MKLILYLLSCCIAVTWQQQNPYYHWSPYRAQYPSPYFFPQSYYNPYSNYPKQFLPSSYQQKSPFTQKTKENLAIQDLLARLLVAQQLSALKDQQDDTRVDFVQDEDKVQGDDDTLARVASNLFRKKPIQEDENDLSRAFGVPNLVLKNQIFGTTTSYRILTSTLTSTSIQSCIAAASFFGGSSQACRRRRDSAAIRDSIQEENEDGTLVNPTAVQSIEATIESSQVNPRSAILDSSLLHEGRAYGYPGFLSAFSSFTGVYGSTTTSTLTSYSISTTTSKKTVLIGSNLSCLPSGYSIC